MEVRRDVPLFRIEIKAEKLYPSGEDRGVPKLAEIRRSVWLEQSVGS